MTELTAAELIEIIATSSGDTSLVDNQSDVMNSSFDELGLDSLAVIESAAAIERRYDIKLPDELVARMPNLRAMLQEANRRITGNVVVSSSDVGSGA